MRVKKIITFLSLAIILSFALYVMYKTFFVSTPPQLFVTAKPQKRNISQAVYATGILEIKNHIKIGSLVSGTIQQIAVKEGEAVTTGQFLALIDNGKADTQVKKYEGELARAQAELAYLENHFLRQKALYEANQISSDFFEKITRDLEQARSDIKIREADLELNVIEYENTRIRSPAEGAIVTVGVTIGERITTDLDATVLFVIAKDITKMEAILDIDESDIGQVKIGQPVSFTVGTYLDKKFKSKITKVSYSPIFKQQILSYKAFIDVDNKDLLLRPGMTINAKIKVAKRINCLSIKSQAFQINPQELNVVAQQLQYKFVPVEHHIKKSARKNMALDYTIKYIWVLQDKNFVEKAIQVSVTDDNHFEVKSGITEKDNVVIDVEEYEQEDSFYKKLFKGAL